jgi:hypothetical protein
MRQERQRNVSQDNQQQGQQEQQSQQSQQSQQEQQASPEQHLAQAVTDIRKVQSMMELNYPDQGEAIRMLRESGDIVWSEIRRMQQAQQQSQQ